MLYNSVKDINVFKCISNTNNANEFEIYNKLFSLPQNLNKDIMYKNYLFVLSSYKRTLLFEDIDNDFNYINKFNLQYNYDKNKNSNKFKSKCKFKNPNLVNNKQHNISNTNIQTNKRSRNNDKNIYDEDINKNLILKIVK